MRALPESDAIAELLKRAKTIAVVGLSDNPFRASHGVSAYMQSQGYHIIPVNPHIGSSLGEKAYASLLDLPEKVDIVNVFRRSEFLEEIVEQAIQLKVAAVWAQDRAAPAHAPGVRVPSGVPRVDRGGAEAYGGIRRHRRLG